MVIVMYKVEFLGYRFKVVNYRFGGGAPREFFGLDKA